MKTKFQLIILSALTVVFCFSSYVPAYAYTYDQNDIIDDSVFNNFNSMSSAQVDSFLNGFPNSCISSNSGFLAIDPSGYSPTNGYQYGGFVTAGKVITDSAQIYGLNPQVLIATLEKEQSLVTGQNNFSGYCNNGSQHKYTAAVGYGCPDSGTTYSYTGVSLYQRNGVTVTSTGTTCVNSQAKAGFSQQVIRAAWLLKFGQQRSRGNVNWAVVTGSWDNSDDPQSCYGGPTAQGTFAVCPSAAATYHDGYYTIDGTAVHINSGATAALYWYTPHFSGNQSFYNIFTGWFGSTKSVPMPGCSEATNTNRACVWYLTGPTGQPYFTSSVSVRQSVVDNDAYTFQGKAFYGNTTQQAGNVPVYRLTKPDGGSFITANRAEYDALASNGWTGADVDFYADPPGSNSGFPVYRLYNSTTGIHQWTGDVNALTALSNAGYISEGQAFTSISPVAQETAPASGKVLVYRFYIPQTYSHFWTTDVGERDSMIKAGYQYENVAWASSATSTGTIFVYRLYAASINQHLYTIDSHERDTLVASGGWANEGVSQYVSLTPNSRPVYRIYAPSLGVHLYTADAHERSQLVSSGRWNDEGVAWYQP